jgi:inorganic triphosphatase YgiF
MEQKIQVALDPAAISAAKRDALINEMLLEYIKAKEMEAAALEPFWVSIFQHRQ